MRRIATALALVAGLAAAPLAAQNAATPHYDLLFKGGTLDAIGAEQVLLYDREVQNREKPDAAARDTGTIALSFETQEGRTLANLMFRKDGQHRNLGSFPASVGNPMIMYFYETVVRDMAESAGGSPFYIRNRVKDALTQPAEVVAGEASWNGETVATQTVTLRPFAEDPNRAQMQGWGDLAMTVTMSEAVPGWYLDLTAHVPGGEAAQPVYHSEMRFEALAEGE